MRAVDGRIIQARQPQQLPHDLGVGAAVEVVAVDGAGLAVHLQQRPPHRTGPGAVGGDERAIDVEEDQAFHRTPPDRSMASATASAAMAPRASMRAGEVTASHGRWARRRT
jgi:hypothetical protein